MKRLALLLALANLGYFAWWQLRPAPMPEPAPAPAQPAAVPLIRLASEIERPAPERPASSPGRSSPASSDPVAGTAAGSPAPSGPSATAGGGSSAGAGIAPRCFLLGPFESRSPAEALAARLAAAGRHAEVLERSEEVVADYWVYLPARTLEEARALQAAVVSRGITDHYLDSGRRLLSLGIYTYRSMAERRLRQLESLGFSPRLEPRIRQRTRYRVLVRPPRDGLSRAALEQLAGEATRVVETGCAP